MESVGTALARLPITVSHGVCTGADNIFVLQRVSETKPGHVIARRRAGGEVIELEEGAIVPMLRGRGISAYGRCTPTHVCVFPYDRRGNVLDEDRLSSKYTRAHEYLSSKRSALLKRRMHPERPWYALRNVNVKPAMAAPKIISSAIGRLGSFAFDADGVLCHNSVITIGFPSKAIDPHYLLGVLNSSPMQEYLRHQVIPMGEGQYALRVEALRRVPLPVAGEQADAKICTAVAQCAAALVDDNTAPSRRPALLSRIDRQVKHLYGLFGRGGSSLAEEGCCAG
jgi:hypothetical protein